MRYFIDTEFLEGTQDKTIFGIKCGRTKPTIDLISIGIVSEDGREYYAISKDFNLEEAWSRCEWKKHNSTHKKDLNKNLNTKVYWIKDNVLKPIMVELQVQYNKETGNSKDGWDFKTFKYLINKYGKTNKQISEEIKEFVGYNEPEYHLKGNYPEFHGYYSDYDWVAFCWLFGKMIELPDKFLYCIDLKQELDRIQKFHTDRYKTGDLKNFASYPKQTNKHSAIHDARWNFKLFEFLEGL
jgi:hypothetical protein